MIKTPINLQDLRRKIGAKAKADTTWRFWGLYVHVCKLETLHEAYTVAGGGPIGGNNKWNWRLRIALYECRHRVGTEHLRELRSFQGVPAWIGWLCALRPTGMVKRPRGIAPGCLAC